MMEIPLRPNPGQKTLPLWMKRFTNHWYTRACTSIQLLGLALLVFVFGAQLIFGVNPHRLVALYLVIALTGLAGAAKMLNRHYWNREWHIFFAFCGAGLFIVCLVHGIDLHKLK